MIDDLQLQLYNRHVIKIKCMVKEFIAKVIYFRQLFKFIIKNWINYL